MRPRGTAKPWNARRPESPRDAGLSGLLNDDERAERASARGAETGETADKYVRTTVFLASVLFLVGISTHFPFRGVRYALVALGALLLLVSLIQLAQLPGPPS